MAAFIKKGFCQKAKAKRGFSLTEIAIVLSIVGLILGSIWAAASNVYDNQKAERASAEVQQIVGAYQGLYGQRGIDVSTAWYDATCIGINSNFFPSDMIVPGTTCAGSPLVPSTYPKTPWGSTSYVQTEINQSTNTIAVFFYNLSQRACLDLARNIFMNASNMTVQGIYNGTAWTSQSLPPVATNTPWTVNTINGLCGTSGNTNAVEIGISRQIKPFPPNNSVHFF